MSRSWTLGGTKPPKKQQTEESEKASIFVPALHLDMLKSCCWNELNGFFSLSVCLSLSDSLRMKHTQKHMDKDSWHTVIQSDLTHSSRNSANSLQIQVPHKSLSFSLASCLPPSLPLSFTLFLLLCLYIRNDPLTLSHTYTHTHTHTHTHAQRSLTMTCYWTAPPFLVCTIYEAVYGQKHI